MTKKSSVRVAAERSALALAALLAAGAAPAQETFKVGIVSFLSGQAAESFGIPAVNGAKVLVEAFNKGAAPAPYNKTGFGGMTHRAGLRRRERRRDQAGAGAEEPVRPGEGRRRRRLRRLGRLPRGRARGRGDEEVPPPLRLRHAADLRGRQVRLRVPHRLARGDGQRRAGALPEGEERQGRDLQPDQPGLRLGPGLEEGLHLGDGEALRRRQAGRGPAAEVRRRPVRHRDLGADGQAGRRHPLQPLGRRPAGLHPPGRAARPVPAHPGGVLRRRPRAARPGREDARTA